MRNGSRKKKKGEKGGEGVDGVEVSSKVKVPYVARIAWSDPFWQSSRTISIGPPMVTIPTSLMTVHVGDCRERIEQPATDGCFTVVGARMSKAARYNVGPEAKVASIGS